MATPEKLPMIHARGLKRHYQRGSETVKALDGVNLDVFPGEMVSILGPSGCGKTTTLRMISGSEQPDEGEVVIGYEVAREYAADRGHELNLELLLYVIHGCLHLSGYTDTDDASARVMRVKEREYLTKLGLPDIAGK